MSASPRSSQRGTGLDVDAVTRWLAASVGLEGTLTARQIAGGRSNLTYELHDGVNRFVLRRPPAGGVLRSAHDVVREHRIVEALQETEVPVSPTVAVCEDLGVIGAPFSVMRFVDGITCRTPDDLQALTPVGRGALTANFARALARLHAVAPEASGLPATKGADFVARQLHVWKRQLEAEPVRPLPAMKELADRLSATIPSQESVSIVHGDYRIDNVLFDRDGVALALIDWELWTLGDPLADLGSAVAYWTDSTYELAALGAAPTQRGELGRRADFLAAYEAAGGHPIDESRLGWYVGFGLWRFAAILEGVYRRNLTAAYGDSPNDVAWQRFAYVVPALAEMGLEQLRS